MLWTSSLLGTSRRCPLVSEHRLDTSSKDALDGGPRRPWNHRREPTPLSPEQWATSQRLTTQTARRFLQIPSTPGLSGAASTVQQALLHRRAFFSGGDLGTPFATVGHP